MAEAHFGPYRLQELLGRGGMGEVYRAHHSEQDRVVALKLLLPSLSSDGDFRERFLRESQLTARLTEPHVIPVHSWGEIDGRLYLDMRFVEGEDLGSRLASWGPLAPSRAVAIVSQVAMALDAAHSQQLVHRDVKPSNVLITATGGAAGNADFAYLVDFGIARSVDRDGQTALTRDGAPIGTLAYMAPERFLGETVDRTTDVYSLACMLYESVTGRRPFEASEMIAVITAHLRAEPPRPSQHMPGVPTALDAVVARGMAKDPAQRYPSAGALAIAAQAAVKAPTAFRPVRVVPPKADLPPPPADPERAPRARHSSWHVRGGWLAAGAAMLAIGLIAVGVLLANGVVGREAAAPTPPSATALPPLSDAQRELLAVLPVGFTATNCAPAADQHPGEVTAALRCGPGPADGPSSATFLRFRDVGELDRFMAADSRERMLPYDSGTCRDGDQVQTTWTKNGQIAGLLACYVEAGNARTIRWTDRRAIAMGVITRTDGDIAALYDWWVRYDFS